MVSRFEVFLAWVFFDFLSCIPVQSFKSIWLIYSVVSLSLLSTVCVKCGICSSNFLVVRLVSSIL